MNNQSVTISIILPTYNGGDCIGRAIKSVQNQSLTNWELIVVIDGSTDATLERVSKIAISDQRIIIVHNIHNQGIQKTLNNGLAKAKGVYIARIDDDDEWIDSHKLQKQYDFLENNPDYVLVGTGIILVSATNQEIGRYLFPEHNQVIRNKLLGQNCFAHPTVMYRKETINQIGVYSEKREHMHIEDHELWLRMGLVGKFQNLNDYAVAYQVATQSVSGKNKFLQFYKKIFICIEYRKKYPNFIINFLKVIFIFVGYMTIGWMFSNSNRVRSKVTQVYKNFF